MTSTHYDDDYRPAPIFKEPIPRDMVVLEVEGKMVKLNPAIIWQSGLIRENVAERNTSGMCVCARAVLLL